MFISASKLQLLLPPFTSQEDNNSLSDLRYGHTNIPNLEPRRMGLEAAALQIFSQLFICFVVNRSRKYRSGMYVSYSIVQKDFDSCETMIVAAKEGESVIQAETCVREK
jgi:hypothetical protein